jgi:hypothetical protein
MAMKQRLGGTWKDITGARVFYTGAWRPIKAIKVYFSGAWRDVAAFTSGAISLVISPTSISKSGLSSTQTTASATAVPSGGLSPYTYSWARYSILYSGSATIVANSPTSASTTFTGSNMDSDTTTNAVFRCTCTDALGSSTTADITVAITVRQPLDGGGTGNL